MSGLAHDRPLRATPIVVGVAAMLLCVFISDGRTRQVVRRPIPERREVRAPALVVAKNDGRAIVGALLTLETSGLRRWSDREGRLFLPDTVGDTLSVTAYGFARLRVPLEEETLRSDSILRLELETGLRATGTVLDELGRVVADAEISAAFDDDPSEPPIVGRVGANGSFVIDSLRPGRWVVTARAPGRGSSSRIVIVAMERPEPVERFVLAATGAIAVHVVDAEGNAVAGAHVEVGGVGFSEPRVATSGPDGRVTVGDLARGVYEVRASTAALSSRRVTGIDVEAAGVTEASVTLEPSQSVSGRVVDASGEALPGVEITLTEDALDLLPRTLETDAEGRFVFPTVPAQPHVLVARLEGHIPFGPVIIVPGEELPTITLVRSATIRGRVTDAAGNPIVGAIVTLVDERGEVRPGAPATGTAAPSLALTPGGSGGTGAGTPMLQAAGDLGIMLGNLPPIPLATIAATPAASSLGSSVASFALGSVTDTRGLFVLVGVPPGTIQLAAHHPMHPSVTSAPRHVRSGETIDDWNLVFPAAGRLLARVVDARSRPLGGVPVELRTDADDVPRTAISDYDGRVVFEGVAGIAVVTAMPSGHAAGRARAEVRAGSEVEIVIALEETRFVLDGRVVDARGAPVEGARVEIASTRARAMLEAFTLSEADGTFHFDALPAPPYRLHADHPEYADFRRDDVRPRDGRLDVRLVQGGVVTGTLVDADDERPIARVVVSLVDGDSIVDEDASDDAGRFHFDRVAPGRYTLRLRPRDHLPSERAIVLTQGRFDAPRLEIGPIELRGAFVIRGLVTDPLGDRVPRARITLPFVEGTPTTTTDAHGAFELRGVAPGSYELWAEHLRAGTARARRPVRGEAREIVSDIEIRLPGRLVVDDRTVDPASVRGVPIVLLDAPSGIVIAWVGPGSAAEAAGLRVGDCVLSVDAELVATRTRAELSLRGPTEIPVELVVGRGTGERRFRITRELYRPPLPELVRLP